MLLSVIREQCASRVKCRVCIAKRRLSSKVWDTSDSAGYVCEYMYIMLSGLVRDISYSARYSCKYVQRRSRVPIGYNAGGGGGGYLQG